MLYYLIICRSLTYAQRTAAALGRAGITAHIFRTPRQIAGEGCSHCVKIRQHDLEDALAVLHQVGLPPKRVFLADNGGGYEEVRLCSIWTAPPPPCKSRLR